jgi:hypothetical protein
LFYSIKSQGRTNPPWLRSTRGLSWCCVGLASPKLSFQLDGLLKLMRSLQKSVTLETWLIKWLLLSRSTLCFNLLLSLWMEVSLGFRLENFRDYYFKFPTPVWQFGVTEGILSPLMIYSFSGRHSL